MSTSTKRMAALVALAVVVLAGAWYVALYRPMTHQLSAAKASYSKAEAKVSQLEGQYQALQALVRRLGADKAALAKLEQAVPDNPDLADALSQLQQVAQSTGVQLSQVGPSAPVVPTAGSSGATSLPSVTLSLSASGTYAQTKAFLAALDQMPRTVVVNHLSMASNGPNLNTTLSAEIFYSQANNTDSASPGAG